jgi:uncharacterized protein YhhL (DUF1145 family)
MAVVKSAVDRKVWALALLVAVAACAHYPLMAAFRVAAQKAFPVYAESWPQNGPFSVLGLYGVEEADQLNYAGKVNEASRRLRPQDPFHLRPLKYFAFDYVSYFVLGALHKIVGNINLTWLVARFICCMLWFVLLFALARHLGQPREYSLLVAGICVCFGYVLSLMFLRAPLTEGGPLRLLLGTLWKIGSYGRTEGVWRLPRPGLTVAALFGVTLFWLKTLEKPTVRGWALTGLLAGLLAYVRIDVWSGMMGALCVFPVLMLACGHRFNKFWLLPPALALPLSAPVLMHMLAPPAEFYFKLGMTGVTRMIDVDALIYIPALAWILYKRRDEKWLAMVSVAVAVFLLCNASLVTGKHYYTFLWRIFGNLFLFLLLAATIPSKWQNRSAWWQGGLAAVLSVCFLQNVLYAGVRYTWEGMPKDTAQALDWLKDNAETDSVVLALSPEVNSLIPAFTRSKVVVGNAWPNLSEVTSAESIARVRFAVRSLGIDDHAFLQELKDPPAHPEQRTHLRRGELELHYLYDILFVRAREAQVAPLIDRELAHAPEKVFRADYLWVGPLARYWLKRAPGGKAVRGKPVLDNGGVQLYRIP